MKTRTIAIVAAALAIAAVSGCSPEGREEAMDRVSAAGRALNGGDSAGRTPDVVRKQQEAEARRQNREWTQENQSKYPVEYCQAQLRTLDRNEEELGVAAHKISVAIGTAKRENSGDAAQLASLAEFLADAKKAYREADAADSWPVRVGGFSLGRERAQEKIVEAARRIPELKTRMSLRENQLAALRKNWNASMRNKNVWWAFARRFKPRCGPWKQRRLSTTTKASRRRWTPLPIPWAR